MDLNYLAFLASILIIAVICDGSQNKPHINYDNRTKRTFLILCGLVIFFMIAFRSKYNGSADSSKYYEHWEKISQLNWNLFLNDFENSQMEPVFLYTVFLLTRIFKEPQLLFVFTGALFSFSVCRFFYKNSEDVLVSVFGFITMGLFNFMVQGMRQAIAMSICLFAFEYVKKRDLPRFTILTLIAFLYHKSAISFLIVYFLYNRKITRNNVLGMSGLFALVSFLSGALMTWGNETFERSYTNAATGGGMVTLVIHILIIALALLFAHDKGDDKKYAFYFYVALLSTVLFVLRYFVSDILERMSFFFSFGQLILIPGFLSVYKTRERRLLTSLVLVIMLAFGIYKFSTTGMSPYNFMWQMSGEI